MATYWILADINAAYVSFCALFNPQLRGTALGVLSSNQGNIIARNQDLKNLGVKMADPAFMVKPLIEKHGGHLWGSNFTLFGDMSERFHNELELLVIDPIRYSVDESFATLDTNCMPDLKAYATFIQSTIKQNLGLEIGIGIGRTKTLAKLASAASKNKKWIKVTKGIVVLDTVEKETWLLQRSHAKEIWGCGSKTTSKLDRQAIRTGLSLRDSDLKFMQSKYGVTIERTILELRGVDAIDLKSSNEPREQICVSKSMGIIVRTLSVLNSALSSHSKEAALKLRRQKSWCRKITIFIGTNHFKTNEPQYHQSMSISLPSATQSTAVLTKYALFVLNKLFRPGFNYRKVGIVLSQIDSSKETQGDLFSHEEADEISNIDKSVDSINARFGKNTIRLASEGFNRDWRPKDDLAPPSYTTNIDDLPTAH